MSKAHAQKFIEKIHKDAALRRKVNDATEHIVKVAKDHGFKVSRADLRHALKEHWNQQRDDEDEAAFVLSEVPGF